jgi:hypothetical protein
MASKSRDKSKLSKNEVAANFVRDWVEFENPANPEEIFKCDLTWLTSYWQCIYGNGCCGIDADKPDAGCCSDGAYYTGKEDEKRVMKRLDIPDPLVAHSTIWLLKSRCILLIPNQIFVGNYLFADLGRLVNMEMKKLLLW